MNVRKAMLILLAINIVILAVSLSVFASTVIKVSKGIEPAQEAPAKTLQMADAIALLAGAIAVAGSTVASGIALRSVATAGFAAAVEKPELTTWMLIMGGLAEGIAVYGLLLAILILGKI
ncbi:ATP synthase subunit C [Infirmifilum uzonense]|uniref:ATP synthase subunit C n=1 Tax=Infirmifilum uzonense TaxID=1550241 RepID=UPI00168D5D20|nr:ATP synthase subunit C [Infirmifilum uzonense]